MRIAAIDIGTNSIHMIVVQIRPDRSFDVIDRAKSMVRLGAGGLDGKALTDEAMAHGLTTLTTFKRLWESHRVDDVVAVATSATREARNGGEFLERIERATGVRPLVISGAEEARLIHHAAMYGDDVGAGKAVVIDIGGGSVEITLGNATVIKMAKSFKIGVIRLHERFVRTDPLSERDDRRIVKHVRDEIDKYCDQIRKAGFDRVIGTSGTILNLGAMATDGRSDASVDLRNLRVPAKQIRRLRRTVTTVSSGDRMGLPGMEPKRVDLIVAGAVLLDTILQRLGAKELTLCDLALREGLVLDYVRRHRREIVHVDTIPDVRRRSALELAERCGYEPEHSRHVMHLALRLFDETRARHALGDREREWLEYASLMHDLGIHISYPRHHQHSYYLIKNGALRGFDPDEIEVIGLVARYHRRGVPKGTDEEFTRLSPPLRRAVRKLAALLRLAESLDRSHAQVVTTLTVQPKGKRTVLRLRCTGDAELEVWAAESHLEPFEALVGKPVQVQVVVAGGSGKRVAKPRSRRRVPA